MELLQPLIKQLLNFVIATDLWLTLFLLFALIFPNVFEKP